VNAYAFNRMMYDLREPANRELARRDLPAYLGRYDLTDEQKRLVLEGDWQGCVDAGASVYVLTKLGAALDVSLLHMGAQMRGQSYQEFMETLRAQNERLGPHALLPGTGGGERG
jgi:protocatechuate 4,5-dioxygenase, alpha chain